MLRIVLQKYSLPPQKKPHFVWSYPQKIGKYKCTFQSNSLYKLFKNGMFAEMLMKIGKILWRLIIKWTNRQISSLLIKMIKRSRTRVLIATYCSSPVSLERYIYKTHIYIIYRILNMTKYIFTSTLNTFFLNFPF